MDSFSPLVHIHVLTRFNVSARVWRHDLYPSRRQHQPCCSLFSGMSQNGLYQNGKAKFWSQAKKKMSSQCNFFIQLKKRLFFWLYSLEHARHEMRQISKRAFMRHHVICDRVIFDHVTTWYVTMWCSAAVWLIVYVFNMEGWENSLVSCYLLGPSSAHLKAENNKISIEMFWKVP
jgi:hypothetical protein